ncbi:C2H2 finger domain protein, putative [Talaromyces stipitatus ATCC 10500]|uniref:C2H2 finger domain protein, putative n=1 Tax=Talaromyces stipitatus (strain ATCC 10500 / CBS 375.48 / QM 6759 / NRRL 1006) TaxID=441959 RepID=B8MIA0_TALSN|nr:C2H2 finger domain protein, putative [Talaromyces stipitatus ATCC 10500]EED14584.1 C2H2 finger domain protein, putative [Talaromyces stipitatus ATCC 10500]
MDYSNSNIGADSTFQRQQNGSDFDDYESPNEIHSHQPYIELPSSQSKYPSPAVGSMGFALPESNGGLGIMNRDMNTGIGMGMGMTMNMDLRFHTNTSMNMTPGTHSLYCENGGTVPFHVQPNLTSSHAVMRCDAQSLLAVGHAVDTNAFMAVGTTSAPATRPIPIPLPNHSFHSASQFTMTPEFNSSSYEYSSSPYYYSASPATSSSSTSIHSEEYNHKVVRNVDASQLAAKSPSPGSPISTSCPAVLDSKSSTPSSPNPPVQLVQKKKSPASFECQKCGRFFTRGADVKRHETSVHSPRPMDCPVKNCVRKGSIGFPRRDHLMEHLRTFHNQNIPKRCGTKKRRTNAALDH